MYTNSHLKERVRRVNERTEELSVQGLNKERIYRVYVRKGV
jgi:hypothetical protein